jgi:hypothetical protein
MAKKTMEQRLKSSGTPYTQLVNTHGALHLLGWFREEKWCPSVDGNDGEWKLCWEVVDLGVMASPKEAEEKAAEWRASLAGAGAS